MSSHDFLVILPSDNNDCGASTRKCTSAIFKYQRIDLTNFFSTYLYCCLEKLLNPKLRSEQTNQSLRCLCHDVLTQSVVKILWRRTSSYGVATLLGFASTDWLRKSINQASADTSVRCSPRYGRHRTRLKQHHRD